MFYLPPPPPRGADQISIRITVTEYRNAEVGIYSGTRHGESIYISGGRARETIGGKNIYIYFKENSEGDWILRSVVSSDKNVRNFAEGDVAINRIISPKLRHFGFRKGDIFGLLENTHTLVYYPILYPIKG